MKYLRPVVICPVILACLIGCQTPWPFLEDRHAKIPADAVKGTPATDPFPPFTVSSEWEAPVPMPGPVNTAGGEDSPFITPDGQEFYFFFTPDVRVPVEGQILDILQPDIGLAGGITETKKIASYAETYNLHVQPHNCASPIATAAAIQLDACITNFIIQEIFPYWPKANYDLVTDALEHHVKDGYLSIPKTPGLGIELNEDALTQYTCTRVD